MDVEPATRESTAQASASACLGCRDWHASIRGKERVQGKEIRWATALASAMMDLRTYTDNNVIG